MLSHLPHIIDLCVIRHVTHSKIHLIVLKLYIFTCHIASDLRDLTHQVVSDLCHHTSDLVPKICLMSYVRYSQIYVLSDASPRSQINVLFDTSPWPQIYVLSNTLPPCQIYDL